jgi:hypothetical protein
MGYGSGSIYFYFIGNFPPSISAIDDQITDENSPTDSIEITILDPESPPETLIVTETSSDKTLVPDENIVLTGSGFNRNMIITPAPGESGTAEITITVSDGNNEVNESFLLTVVPLPDSDGDGLPDIDEDINNNGFVDIGETDPYNPDTDFDGLYDGVEVKILGTNPLMPDSDGNGIFDGDEDNDGDGFTNMEEVQCGSDPGNPNSKCLNGLPWLMLLLD